MLVVKLLSGAAPGPHSHSPSAPEATAGCWASAREKPFLAQFHGRGELQLSHPQETHQSPPIPGSNDRKQDKDISRHRLGPSDMPGRELRERSLRAAVPALLLHEV